MTSIEGLYKDHKDAVLSRAISLVGNRQDAEDLVQETFITAQRHLATFDGRAPRTWLSKILTGHVKNWRARQKRRPDKVVGLDPSSYDLELVKRPGSHRAPSRGYDVAQYPAPDEAAAGADSIERCLACLSPAQKAVVALLDLWGLSVAQAAHILGIKEGAVKMRHMRARTVLKNCLEDRDNV